MKIKKPSIKWCSGLAEAAGVLGVDVKLIQQAKRHPAFKHCYKGNGRVAPYLIQPLLKEYEEELAEQVPEDAGYWKAYKAKYDALIAERNFEELDTKYILRETVEGYIKGLAQAQKAVLKSKLVSEYPQQLLGLSVPEIASKMETLVTEVCDIMQNIQIPK